MKLRGRERDVLPVAGEMEGLADLGASLQRYGCRVTTARGCPAALAAARAARPHLAVIGLFPLGGNGLDLMADLLAHHPDLPVIVVSRYLSVASATEAGRRGAVASFLELPSAEGLLATVDERRASTAGRSSLAREEYDLIHRVLRDCGGNISLAARQLGLGRKSLQRKLAKNPPGR